jgi:hypothetical protein
MGILMHTDHQAPTVDEKMSANIGNEKTYVRDIINNLRNGITVVFKRESAGIYADILDLILENYESTDVASLETTIETLKNKYAPFKELLETAEETSVDPDYTISKTGKTVFTRLTGVDVWNLPDIEWLVSGILQRSTTTLLVGSGNVGKTFVWLDACMCIAHGEKWLNRKTRQGRVLYIYAEGSGGLKQRYKAWMIEHGKATLKEITDTSGKITFIPRPVNLLNDRQMLLDTIEDEPEIPEEVVVDTFSMCSSGVDENSNSEVAKYLATASEIKLKYGCHVTIIHHMNKSGGFRGASALRDNVDTMITLDRGDDLEGPIKVECSKQRDAEYFPSFKLNLKTVELGINAFTMEPITSCVVELDDGENTGTSNQTAMPEKQKQMLDILAIHGSLTSSIWQKRCLEESGIAKTTFNRNLELLIAYGKVQRSEYIAGKQKRVSYSIPNTTGQEGSDDDE